MKCADCGRGPLIPAQLWREIAFWERPPSQRKAGTGSQGVDRHPTGRAICGGCAIKREHGLSAGQGALDV